MEKKKEKKRRTKWIIMSLFLILAVGLLIGYLYYHSHYHNGRFSGRNFPPGGFNGTRMLNLNQSQINSITSFFSSNPSISDMQNYCMSNRGYCFYYCRNINPNSEICSQISNYTNFNRTQGGTPT